MIKINPKLAVTIGVIFVSFSAILIKLSEASPLAIAFYRMLFSTLLVLPIMVYKKSDEIKQIKRKTLSLSIISGVFLALHFASWITSIEYTSIASSTVLVTIHPIFIVFGGYLFLKEKVSLRIILSILIALLGSIIISLGDYSAGGNATYGNILAVLGALFVSFYMMIGKVARKNLSATTYTFIVYLSCTIALFILALISNVPIYPYSSKEWLIFIALAVFPTILGHSIFNWSLEYVKTTFLSTAILGEPVFASISAFIIFNEVPSSWNIIGGLTVIIGILLFVRNDRTIAAQNDIVDDIAS
ncbi:DMT family transporter [Sporosalibacterium faouarense]|uniref:DMT family transporter n=1 Tax=Sporosalibacterium faouarense TaxID=516123 RepID=UPI00141C5003|nr:DMT family transporter [Sporosalibacterium faouarense]MTI46341.1 DMT family transporter [Bacillota bacterium]